MFLIGNCSSHRQIRWTDCIVPNDAAADFPVEGFSDGVFFQKAGSRPCGTTFHLLADVAGNSVLVASRDPVASKLTPAISKLCPDPSHIQLQLQVGVDQSPFAIVRTEGLGTHRVRFHMRAAVNGYCADLILTVWSFCDLVDVAGRVRWSDPRNPGHWSPMVGDQVSIYASQGSWNIDYALKWGIRSGSFTLTPLVGTSYPDGMDVPFYGFWSPSFPVDPPVDDPLAGFWEQRRQTALAALEGPLMAMWGSWDGHLFAAGKVPSQTPDMPTAAGEWQRFRSPNVGRIYDQREFASPLNTGQTGDIQAFGLVKDMVLFRGKDPRRLYQLRESTVDYMLRCHHHAELDGKPVQASQHPGVMTWNLALFHTGSDMLGKATETPGPPHAFGRPFVDDEHRADTYIGTIRHVTDDPLLELDLLDRIEMDKLRAFRKNRWIPTPRASGRLLQSWAMAYWTAWTEASRKDMLQLSMDEFSLRSTQLQTPTGLVDRASLGPVRPANVIATDQRVIDGGPAWVPWNDACLLTGLWHQIALWEKVGQKELAASMRAYWLEVAETILKYGTVRAADGLLYPINGVLWLPNGEAQPASYYTFPRAGASFGDDAYDMLVGTLGWFGTLGWPTVVTGYLKIGSDSDCFAIAKELSQQSVLANPSMKTAEWMV